ncbi:hypothetical protein J5N97_001835 [Dioscorea zingiberensis]|uniref:Uncharacterized protein n=1 Tax=Dioscorea zingiberensis TaxID=325984 RepID=A0A9D5H206_9LILI|nr:hypothetical protein J5N97_001835 [Dioscorea zingiberensis]
MAPDPSPTRTPSLPLETLSSPAVHQAPNLIVLHFTSLGVVRKIFEDCRAVRILVHLPDEVFSGSPLTPVGLHTNANPCAFDRACKGRLQLSFFTGVIFAVIEGCRGVRSSRRILAFVMKVGELHLDASPGGHAAGNQMG